MNTLSHLPGGELIAQGLDDTAAGRISPAACLIAIAWPRLVRAGMDLRSLNLTSIAEPERRLYQFLGAESGDAYSRYNALIRQLLSFESAFERENANRRTPAL
jgi:hypothetical protein